MNTSSHNVLEILLRYWENSSQNSQNLLVGVGTIGLCVRLTTDCGEGSLGISMCNAGDNMTKSVVYLPNRRAYKNIRFHSGISIPPESKTTLSLSGLPNEISFHRTISVLLLYECGRFYRHIDYHIYINCWK